MAALQAFLLRKAAYIAGAYGGSAPAPANSSAKKTDPFTEEEELALLQEALDAKTVPTGALLEKLKRFMLLTQMIEQAKAGNILIGGERLFVAKIGGWPATYTSAMLVAPSMNYVSNNPKNQHENTSPYVDAMGKKLAQFVFKPKPKPSATGAVLKLDCPRKACAPSLPTAIPPPTPSPPPPPPPPPLTRCTTQPTPSACMPAGASQ